MLDPASLSSGRLTASLRTAVYLTALINLAVGLAFLLGPEIGLTLWPTPIPPVLMRFIGSIVLGNGVGAWLVARGGTWEGARALVGVALVYGVVVLAALLYHLLVAGAPGVFWTYALIDALFLAPIAYIYIAYERAAA